MAQPIAVELLKHNLWANQKILDACAGLSGDHLAAEAPGTYGAVIDTLVHMLAAEGRYASQFTKENAVLAEDAPFPGWDALRQSAHASGSALVRFAGDDDRMLHGTYRDRPYEMRGAFLLTQAVNHATEHRAHVVSILSQRGVATPRLDSLAYFQEVGNG